MIRNFQWKGKVVIVGIVIPRGSLNPLPRGTMLELTGEIGSESDALGQWRLPHKNIWLCGERMIYSKRGKAVVLEEWISLDAFNDRNRVRYLLPGSPIEKALRRRKKSPAEMVEDIKRSVFPSGSK